MEEDSLQTTDNMIITIFVLEHTKVSLDLPVTYKKTTSWFSPNQKDFSQIS